MTRETLYYRLKDTPFIFDSDFKIIPNGILKNNCLSYNTKIAFAMMQKYKNEDDDHVLFQNKTLADDLGVSSSTVTSVISELEDNNYIHINGKRNKRKIKFYSTLKDIFKKKDYVRIPNRILQHNNLNSKGKVLYTILLSLQYYKLLKEGFKEDVSRTWFTLPITRQRLSERLNCSVDSVSETLIKLNNSKINDTPLIYNSNGKFYSRKDIYSCNILTPVSKKGYYQLVDDEEIDFDDPYSK
mgnify:CR=1 FL=1